MRVLVTGGAGYIGSHAVRLLQQSGHDVWVYDNLSTGHREAVCEGILLEGELSDGGTLRRILGEKQIEAVMHFAASALVGESVADPGLYYRNNVIGTCTLLEAMRDAGVSKFVFSSTCATYGTPQRMPITEQEEQHPINPYGFTKLIIERALSDYCSAYQWGYAALRYFNAAGASKQGDIGEDHAVETHLIPLVLQTALGQREAITVYGGDYPTPDGTCIRDYIHVDDLATAHLAALEKLQPGQGMKLNLGTGHGYSVNEVIEACRWVTGRPIAVRMGARRAGDPPTLVADSSLAQKTLNWKPQFTSIESIVESAWKWHEAHPHGFRR